MEYQFKKERGNFVESIGVSEEFHDKVCKLLPDAFSESECPSHMLEIAMNAAHPSNMLESMYVGYSVAKSIPLLERNRIMDMLEH